MISGSGKRLFGVAALVVFLFGAGAAVTAGIDDSATLGQSIVLARLDEIRAIGEIMREHTWPGFDPLALPAVFYEPGGWAFAIGFPEPPTGFTVVAGVKHGERALYQAALGVFPHPGTLSDRGHSPAIINGKWAVVSTFDPPRTPATGARMGREAGEEALGRFVGDAFAIFLMERRGRSTPFVTGSAAYPESAELMALTTLEQRMMTTPLQMANLTEKTMDEFHRMVQTVVAIRHARYKLMGEELAGLEREIELSEGLRLFTTTMVHRHAMNRSLVSTDPGRSDATFVRWVNGGALRMLGMGYPMFSTVDNPAFTLPQVAVRGAVLGALIDKTGTPWHPQGVAGDTALIDILAKTEKLDPEAEPALLAGAKQEYHYDAILSLAQDDLNHLKVDRAAWMRLHLPPGPGHLEIVLPAGHVTTYTDDPWTTGHLGEGRLTHPGGLTLKSAGLEVEVSPGDREGPWLVVTESGANRRDVRRLRITLPPGASPMVAGKPYKASGKRRPLSDMEPLTLQTPGLRLKVTAGSAVKMADGSLQVAITH